MFSLPSLPWRNARVIHLGMFVCLSVCLSGRVTQKLLLRSTWFLDKNYYACGSVLLRNDRYSEPDRDYIIYLRILHHCEIGQTCHLGTPRRQTCVMMKTCVMTSRMRDSEGGSVISDFLVISRLLIRI